jgi:hypothetical protein
MSPVSTPAATYGCRNHSHANSAWRARGAQLRAAAPSPCPLPILIPLDPPLALAFYYPEWEGTRAGEGSFDRCWRIDPLHPRHSINKHGQPHPVCVHPSPLLSINLCENIKCLAEHLWKDYNSAFAGNVHVPRCRLLSNDLKMAIPFMRLQAQKMPLIVYGIMCWYTVHVSWEIYASFFSGNVL